MRSYFVLLLLMGLALYKDYGLSWDEPVHHLNGMVSVKYVASRIAPGWTDNKPAFANVPDIHGYLENDHGALFEMPLVVLDQTIGIADSRTYYLMRHFAVFLIFTLGTWALYNLGRIRFRSWKMGLLLSTLLVLSPRFFAESFYNGSDVVFLSLFTVGIYTLVRLLKRPSPGRAALHGLATAAAVDIRILGIMLIAMTLGMVAVEVLFGSSTRQRRFRLAKTVPVYLLVAVAAIILFWPYLWEAPVHNFLTALENMKKFRWGGEVLYLGKLVWSLALPWHYAPVWITVTTPIAYTVAFVAGTLGAVYALLRHNLAYVSTFEGRLDILFIGWFFLPIIMVIALHSVIYDGWRHLYFVYPALLLLAGRGAHALWQAGRQIRWMRPIAIGATALAGLEMAYTISQMVMAHPQEQVYFSCISGPDAERLFERDYWGLSYREGLEWILRHDSAPQLNVTCQNAGLLENSLSIMKPEDRTRFRVGGKGREQYFLGAYRAHPGPYPDSVGQEIHAIKAYGMKVVSIFHRW